MTSSGTFMYCRYLHTLRRAYPTEGQVGRLYSGGVSTLVDLPGAWVPKGLLTYQAHNIDGTAIRALCEELRIEKRHSSPYHPQGMAW